MDREERIMRYIMDDLDDHEVQRIEEEMKADPAFAQEVEELLEMENHRKRKPVRKKAKDALEIAHEEFMLDFGKHDMGDKKVWRKISGWFLLLITSLIILGYLLRSDQQSSSSQGSIQFAEYFSPEKASFQTKGDSDLSKELIRAQILFNEEKYDEAIESFETYFSENEETINHRFYYALALLGNDRNTESINELVKIGRENSLYANECYWYTALGLIKESRYQEAQSTLKKIETSSSKYNVGQQLLEELEFIVD